MGFPMESTIMGGFHLFDSRWILSMRGTIIGGCPGHGGLRPGSLVVPG